MVLNVAYIIFALVVLVVLLLELAASASAYLHCLSLLIVTLDHAGHRSPQSLHHASHHGVHPRHHPLRISSSDGCSTPAEADLAVVPAGSTAARSSKPAQAMMVVEARCPFRNAAKSRIWLP